MNTVTLHITIEVDDDFFCDENYSENMTIIESSVNDIADSIDGVLLDLEIK